VHPLIDVTQGMSLSFTSKSKDQGLHFAV
jgi:hypothetical protein